jgi:hypothetical protein
LQVDGAMSALPPIAEITKHCLDVRFVPFPDKVQRSNGPTLFNHLVGQSEYGRRHFEIKRFRCLEI